MSIIETRQTAIQNLVDEVDSIKVNMNSYYNDLEYKDFIDSSLAGKLLALRQYADAEGWMSVVAQIDKLTLDYPEANVLVNLEVATKFILPETRRLVVTMSDDEARIRATGLWDLVHPRVQKVSRSRFETGHYADAVESAFKELNAIVKASVLNSTDEEFDGAKLMHKAFGGDEPLIKLAMLGTESGRSLQEGYHLIFAGAMTGIRNPNAHAVLDIDRRRAMHLVYLASLLFGVYEERI